MPDPAQSPAPVRDEEPRPSIGDRVIEKLSRQVAGLTQQLAITEAVGDELREQVDELKAQLVAATAATLGDAPAAAAADLTEGRPGRQRATVAGARP